MSPRTATVQTRVQFQDHATSVHYLMPGRALHNQLILQSLRHLRSGYLLISHDFWPIVAATC